MKRKKTKRTTLLDLSQEIKQAKSMDSLSALVHCLNSLSRWHARGINNHIKVFKEINQPHTLKKLKTLQEYFVKTGFKKGGINQTKPGLIVNEFTVFLGGNGLEITRQSVHFWRQRKSESVNGNNVYQLVSQQAQTFINLHITPMVKIIDDLEPTLAKSIAV